MDQEVKPEIKNQERVIPSLTYYEICLDEATSLGGCNSVETADLRSELESFRSLNKSGPRLEARIKGQDLKKLMAQSIDEKQGWVDVKLRIKSNSGGSQQNSDNKA